MNGRTKSAFWLGIKHKGKRLFNLIKNLIIVPKCASCDERLSPIPEKGNLLYDKLCFCSDCAEKWQRAKAEACPNCYNRSPSCSCTPDFFFNYQPEIPSLCFYHPENNDVQSKAIITMKHRLDDDLFDFMAIELYPSVESLLTKLGLSGKDCIFTWVPRKSSSISKSGFDQGKELANSLARLYGTKPYPLFLRIGGKEQKRLSNQKRKRNAKKSIKLNQAMLHLRSGRKEPDLSALVAGKSIVIVDDVLTSGSTLRQAVELLISAKAENAVVVCVAKTYGKTEKKKN